MSLTLKVLEITQMALSDRDVRNVTFGFTRWVHQHVP